MTPGAATVPLAVREQIDALCLTFEDAWQANRPEPVDDFLTRIDAAWRNELLQELLLIDVDYRQRRGEGVAAAQYLALFPGDEQVIARVFESPLLRREAPPLDAGTRIGRYRIDAEIGRGAFAVVYRAWDLELERVVAVKVPRHAELSQRDTAMFLAEARTVARLRHPAIVPIYDVGLLDHHRAYLVMQYIDGDSLEEVLDRGPLAASAAARLVCDAAEAVAHAHRQGLVHRDLKPSNLLLDHDERVFVTDFGLAILEHDRRRLVGQWAGTLPYMAPEQVRGDTAHVDARTDIWALGVLLYELVTQQHPFQGSEPEHVVAEILAADPQPLQQRSADVPPAYERICLKCLSKDPGQRYASACDLIRDLRALTRGPARRHRAQWALAVLSLALLLTLAAWGWPRMASPQPPLQGTLDVLLWRPTDRQLQGVPLTAPGAVPLLPGDQVRLQVRLNRPAYAYVIWLDAQGQRLPVYPWQAGDWDTRPLRERPRDFLALPAASNACWTMAATPPGRECVLLLVRETPLPDDRSLTELLSTLAPLPADDDLAVAWFENGALVTPHTPRWRSPEPAGPGGEPQPLAATYEFHPRSPEFQNPQALSSTLAQQQQRFYDLAAHDFDAVVAIVLTVAEASSEPLPALRSNSPE